MRIKQRGSWGLLMVLGMGLFGVGCASTHAPGRPMLKYASATIHPKMTYQEKTNECLRQKGLSLTMKTTELHCKAGSYCVSASLASGLRVSVGSREKVLEAGDDVRARLPVGVKGSHEVVLVEYACGTTLRQRIPLGTKIEVRLQKM